jgi:hypothetical protein
MNEKSFFIGKVIYCFLIRVLVSAGFRFGAGW